MLTGAVAVPAAGEALAAAVVIAVFIVAAGIVFVVRQLTNALFGWLISALEKIPVIGGALAGPFKSVEQAVSHALGKAEHSIDGALGASWHLMARFLDWQWRELRGHAALLLQFADLLPGVGTAIQALRSLVHHTAHSSTAQGAQVKKLEKEYHGIERQLRTLEKEYRGIDATGIGKRIGAVEKDLATIEAQTIPAIQQTDTAQWGQIGDLYDWVRGKLSLPFVGTFAFAVAAAIGLDAFRALRCPSFLNSFRNRKCGLFDGIENLLGWLVDLFVITTVCDVLPYLEEGVSLVAVPFIDALSATAGELCNPTWTHPPTLTGPPIVLPDVYYIPPGAGL